MKKLLSVLAFAGIFFAQVVFAAEPAKLEVTSIKNAEGVEYVVKDGVATDAKGEMAPVGEYTAADGSVVKVPAADGKIDTTPAATTESHK